MDHAALLRPIAALVLWTFAMWVWLYATRIPAIEKSKIAYDPTLPNGDFEAKIPARVRWKADNYNNLMEQPPIFYAVCLMLTYLGVTGSLVVALAWVYVVVRIAHSLVHALINRVMIRFGLFAIGSVTLLVLTLRVAFAIF